MRRRWRKPEGKRQWGEITGRASPQARVNGWIAGKRSLVICGARSGAYRDGKRTKGCPSCVTSTLAAPQCTRTGKNWTSGGEVTLETFSVLTLLRPLAA